jgi:hypothetical protein
MHFPAVSFGTETALGFRTNEMGYWRRDQMKVLRSTMKLEWMPVTNWDREELSGRGRVTPTLADAKILLVGGGALGATVAEQLVRCGTHHMTVLDGELLAIGNLCRHTLTMKDLLRPKATALAARLNQLSPHADVTAIDEMLSDDTELAKRLIGHDMVIDCTANDDVIEYLKRVPWGRSTVFLSASVGIQARRLFCFACRGDVFSADAFHATVAPWLLQERQQFAGEPLPREGIGCWHPVFPARCDDVSLFASVTVKEIERAFLTAANPQLSVFEQEFQAGEFVAVRRVHLPEVSDD